MNAPANAYLVIQVVPTWTASIFGPAPPNLPVVGQIFRLIPSRHVLGRFPGANISISLPWMIISRRQAVIEYFVPGSWEIEDLQSRNGTHVNGQKLNPNTLHPLNDGDRISFCDLVLLFTFNPQAICTGSSKKSEELLEYDEFR